MLVDRLTEERFLKQVLGHQLTILREDGVYRHLRVGKPGTVCESWHIHTWPGYLAMVGDMGDWVFQRLEDMFDFFRPRREGKLDINLRYWAEKLQAQDRQGGWEQFSIDAFHKAIEHEATEACDVETYAEVPGDRKEELRELLCAEDEWSAVTAVRDFDSDWLDLTDFWEHSCKEVNQHFVFACYAIAWTVKLYDQAKNGGGA